MGQKSNMEGYQKPELIHIDDPAFDETGYGQWVNGASPNAQNPPGNTNPPGNNLGWYRGTQNPHN